ncbi:MAG TPA: hypothetical protein VN874_00660 [Myxococcales bacterium]|nr:hypothetical protein [Myxococcales bacterium]
MALLCLAAAMPLAARADGATPTNEDAGPLGLRIQGTLRELFLDVTGADARALARPQLQLRYSFSNIWNEPMQLARHSDLAHQGLDEQADVLDVKLRLPWSLLLGPGPSGALPGSGRPLWERLTTSFDLRATEHWGGWSDGAIEAWHSLIGSFNFNRQFHPRNQIHLTYADAGGTAFDIQGATFALGDVALRTQLLLVEGGTSLAGGGGPVGQGAAPSRYGLSARLDLKLPTGSLSRAGGSGGFDAAIGLVGTAEVASYLTLHALAAFSWFSPMAAPVLLQVKPWHATFELSAVFDLGPLQLILEDRIATPLLQPGWTRLESGGDNGLLSSGVFASFRPHNQISFALRRGPFALWLSEDFTPGPNPRSVVTIYYESNSPDLTVGASLTFAL